MHAENEVSGYYNNQGEYIPKQVKAIKWCCPKCRCEYLPAEVPQKYECFCKKEEYPKNHPWLVPHSCGEICGKQLLNSICGHRCMLLCHPGPCPPCPQMITTSCECNQSIPRTVRCSQRIWKCNKKVNSWRCNITLLYLLNQSFQCNRKLTCGIHSCEMVCHKPDNCPPCKKKSQQRCVCGNRVQERDCNNLTWQCDKVCDKYYECGRHKCKEKCHVGDCGPCPNGLPRSCPCGKEVWTESKMNTEWNSMRLIVHRLRKHRAARRSVCVATPAKNCSTVANIIAPNDVIEAIVVSVWKSSTRNVDVVYIPKNFLAQNSIYVKRNASEYETVVNTAATVKYGDMLFSNHL